MNQHSHFQCRTALISLTFLYPILNDSYKTLSGFSNNCKGNEHVIKELAKHRIVCVYMPAVCHLVFVGFLGEYGNHCL